MVRILLSNGASPNVLQPSGEIFHCSQYQGVQHLLDTHLSMHSQQVFEAIADKKGRARLRNIFLVCSNNSSGFRTLFIVSADSLPYSFRVAALWFYPRHYQF